MKQWSTLSLVVLALAAACEMPTATQRTVFEVEITPGDLHLAIDETHEMNAVARDPRGSRLNGVAFQWTSSDPATVSVSSSGIVTAQRGGSAVITAHAGSASGSMEVSVGGPLPAECGSVLPLAVSEVYTAPAGEAALLCLDGGVQGAQYTLIPFYGTAAAGAVESFEVTTRNALEASSSTSAAQPVTFPLPSDTHQPMDRSPTSSDWELRLRQREIRELTPLIPTARETRAWREQGGVRSHTSPITALPVVGAQMSLNVNSDKACTDPILRQGEVVAISERAIVLADTTNPAGGFDAADYEAFTRAFDTAIYPVVARHFGAPSDVDQNGRTLIFFTRAVNEMTRSASSVVGGFFFSRDLFPRTGTNQQQACGASNEAEIVYLMVPDPVRGASQPVFSRESVQRGTLSVLAHEFQHLVNASQRLFVQKSSTFEEVWLNEGMSHIAEELVGNHIGHIGRGENVTHSRITSSPEAWELFSVHHRANFGRLAEHLRSPSTTAVFDPAAPLASRGATWQFLRYAADRKGGQESDFWRALSGSTSSGLRNLHAALENDPISWMRDWAVAVYTDDWLADVDARWDQPAWHFRSILSGIRADHRFPLAMVALPAAGTTEVSLTAGGAAYLRLDVAAGSQAEIRTTWNGGLTPPHRLLMSVVRTR